MLIFRYAMASDSDGFARLFEALAGHGDPEPGLTEGSEVSPRCSWIRISSRVKTCPCPECIFPPLAATWRSDPPASRGTNRSDAQLLPAIQLEM